jgi:signal transduction histidine kinase/DNA-binding response OmpR family regulator
MGAQGLDFRLLFEESPEVLLVLLPDAPRYTMVAGTHSRWRATHTTAETLGRGLFEVFPDNPDDPTATGTSNLRASLERVVKTRQPDTMPVQKYDIRGPDGTFEARYWSPKNLPVLSPSGEVLYILHRVEDVTQLVRANELGEELRGQTRAAEREVIQRSHELAAALRELRTANSKLAELDRAKTEFFSNVSHEFRTPLTLMLGPLEDELSERKAWPREQRVRVETAHRNALRLLKLVNSLLDFSRTEAGRSQASFAPTDLAALTRDLVSVFRSATEKAELELLVDCPDLPEPVYVDREMWEKIVFNLLSNAFKHTFEGSIGVTLRWCGESLELRVSDTGVGIAEADLPRLFERFHRVKGVKSRSHEGTGIGLALVQELAMLHGGSVRVESTPKVGSTFIVTIRTGTAHLSAERVCAAQTAASSVRPGTAYVEEALHWLRREAPPAAPLEARREIHPEAGRDGKGPEQASVTESSRPRILWADDNADMRQYVADLLGRHYDVVTVPDGEAALEAVRATLPDLVLSDIMMPRLDGFGLLKALRADERTARLPIILLSARTGEEAAVGGLDAGADDYLVKPFSARELLARVRTHVELARQRQAWESELERRVKERTMELAAAVEQLAAENSRRQATELKLEAQLQRMNLLDRITRAIAERQDLRSIFQVVVRSVEENLPAAACWIGLKDSDTERLVLRNELVYESEVRDASWLPRRLAEVKLRSVVTAPLRTDHELLGVLVAGRREPAAFSSSDCEFLRQLSEHVALAARQAQLHQSLQAAYDELRLTQQAVLQQERLSALGQMASGIAHDINNAISPIALYVESLLGSDNTLSPRARQVLPIVLRAIDDVAATLARMREFYRSREPQLQPVPVDMSPLVEQVLELTRARWSDMPQQRGHVITVTKELAPALPPVSGFESEFREALTNLIFNAVDAMPDGGTLSVRTVASGSNVHLEVSDTGIGMGEDTRRKCLEPFFTTKGQRGTGLGLAMVYGVVQRHAGDIQIETTPGRGTTFRLVFPVTQVAAVTPASEPSVEPARPLRILLIDDDPTVLRSLSDALQAEGHTVVAVNDSRDGVARFLSDQTSEPFAAVITDLGMPHLDGRAVAKAVKEASPGTPVIMLTGWGQPSGQAGDPPLHVDCLLGKPPKLREIRAALAQCCAESGIGEPETAARPA